MRDTVALYGARNPISGLNTNAYHSREIIDAGLGGAHKGQLRITCCEIDAFAGIPDADHSSGDLGREEFKARIVRPPCPCL